MIFLDCETDMAAPPSKNLVCVNINGVVYERRKLGDTAMRELFESIKGEVICGHNIKFDIKTIYWNFGVLLDKPWCTLVAAKILRNGMREKSGAPIDNSLVACLSYFLGIREEVHKQKKEIRTKYSLKRDLTPLELEYVKADVVHLPALQERLEALVKEAKLDFVFREEMALIPVLVKKEVRGVRVDVAKLEWLTKVWKRGKSIAVRMLDREVGALMNRSGRPMLFITYGYGSTKQVTQIFKDLRLPVPVKKERTKNEVILKESNDEDTLTEYLYEYPDSPMKRFIEIYLWYKEIEKLISTYGDTLISLVDANGYVHTEYNQLGALTGRLSSSAPNLQNIGNQGHGAKVRTCFLPDEGQLFVDNDMKSAEIRIAADLSGEKLLVANVLEGTDMHSQLASASYSVICGEPVNITDTKTPIIVKGERLIPSRIRTKHKAVVFSWFYGASAERFYTILGDDVRKFQPPTRVKAVCKEIHAELCRQLPVLAKWFEDIIEQAKGVGYLRTPKSNRIRYFDRDAHGAASNHPIQSINAEAIKVAMINMDRWLEETGYGRLVLNIHDQLITSCNPEYVELVKAKQTQVMADALSYFLTTIKGASSCKVTKYWEK